MTGAAIHATQAEFLALFVGWRNAAAMIDTMIDEAGRGLPLQRSSVLPSLRAGQFDAAAAALEIARLPDMRSYHLLFALRRTSPELYRSLPDGLRARVLVDALANVVALNDWGYLDPSGSHDDEAARALLETGGAAIGPLNRLLADERPAPLFGSEPATLSSLYHYRRKDFADRYLSLLIGRAPTFEADPAARDAAIADLAAAVARTESGGAKP